MSDPDDFDTTEPPAQPATFEGPAVPEQEEGYEVNAAGEFVG